MRQTVRGAALAVALWVCTTMLGGAAQTPATPAPALEALTLRIIVVASNVEARRVIDQLGQGTDFSTLAASVSQDPTRRRGGLLGRTSLQSLRQELRDALQGLSVGQVTRPVPIATGYAVLKVVEDVEAGDTVALPASVPSVAAVGAVRYLFDVSGFNDATVVMQRHPHKPAGWNLDPATICAVRTASLLEAQLNLRANLASPEVLSAGQPMDLAQAHFTKAQLLAYEGRMREAIQALSEALGIARAKVPAMRLHMEEALGIAYLHTAMHDSDVYHAPGDRCLLTLTPRQSFGPAEDVQRAIAHFTAYLRERPDDLEVRWLLNVAYVTAGTYPDAVPPAHRIAPAAFASGEDIGRFVDESKQVDRTIETLQKAVATPSYANPMGLAVLGLGLKDKKHYDQAIPPLEKAAELAPKWWMPRWGAAWSYFGQFKKGCPCEPEDQARVQKSRRTSTR